MMRAAVVLVLLSLAYGIAGTADQDAGQLLTGPYVLAVLLIALLTRPRRRHDRA